MNLETLILRKMEIGKSQGRKDRERNRETEPPMKWNINFQNSEKEEDDKKYIIKSTTKQIMKIKMKKISEPESSLVLVAQKFVTLLQQLS